MDINTYNLKLQEIDRQIDDITKQFPSTVDFSNKMSSSQYAQLMEIVEKKADIYPLNTAYREEIIRTTIPIKNCDFPKCGTIPYGYDQLAANQYGENLAYYTCKVKSAQCRVYNLSITRAATVLEMQREQQYLKNQYILQQQQATAFAEQQALKAAEEVRAAANKTEQELQIANQKLAQANEALAKQKAAESLAKSVDTGNLEAGRILMGINTVSKYKTPLIIGAVTLTVLALGFVGYKMLAKAKKV